MTLYFSRDQLLSPLLPSLPQLSIKPIPDTWVNYVTFAAPHRYRTLAPTGMDTSAVTTRLSAFLRDSQIQGQTHRYIFLKTI